MKELTSEGWQKKPTPRMMWVWDHCEKERVRRKVVYFSEKNIVYPVIALRSGDTCLDRFQHCAEIEKQRRMTNKELARWLREKPTREVKHCNGSNDNFVYCFHTYLERCANEEVDDLILVREDYGEWREPLVEVEE